MMLPHPKNYVYFTMILFLFIIVDTSADNFFVKEPLETISLNITNEAKDITSSDFSSKVNVGKTILDPKVLFSQSSFHKRIETENFSRSDFQTNNINGNENKFFIGRTTEPTETRSMSAETSSKEPFYEATTVFLSKASSLETESVPFENSVTASMSINGTPPSSYSSVFPVQESTIPVESSKFMIAFYVFIMTAAFTIVVAVAWWRRRSYKLEQLRLQLLPVYNYDPADDQEDCENELIAETVALGSDIAVGSEVPSAEIV